MDDVFEVYCSLKQLSLPWKAQYEPSEYIKYIYEWSELCDVGWFLEFLYLLLLCAKRFRGVFDKAVT